MILMWLDTLFMFSFNDSKCCAHNTSFDY